VADRLERCDRTAARRRTSVAAANAARRTATVKTGAGARKATKQTVHAPSDVIAGMSLTELLSTDHKEAGPRSKRKAIVEQAVGRFGEIGYEATKWSSVSDELGIGQAALYYYFESKAHCLLTIIRLELARSYQRFLEATALAPSAAAAIEAALQHAFQVSPAEVRQLRIVVANGDVLANPRSSEREEQERKICLALARSIEDAWTELLARNMAEGAGGDGDARMVARAVLGMLNSVWRWYRPKGALSINQLSDFYVTAALNIINGADYRRRPPRDGG